jgi:hypothetical protein
MNRPAHRLPIALLTLAAIAACSEYEVQSAKDEPEPPREEPEPDLEPPVAVAGPAVAVKREQQVNLDGTGSYDPDGGGGPAALSYQWTANDPAAGGYDLRDADGATPAFSAPELGVWQFELTVTDADGLQSESPAYTTVEVVPWEDLQVSLTWQGTGLDLDLHLLAPDGAYYTDSDCFFGNPEPDWGVAGSVADNPFLAADDDMNGGPEIIELSNPEEATYRILVHHFSDHGEPNPAAKFTVVVSSELGDLARTEQWLYEAGQVLDVGVIDWSTQTVTIDPQLTSHAGLGGPDVNEPAP